MLDNLSLEVGGLATAQTKSAPLNAFPFRSPRGPYKPTQQELLRSPVFVSLPTSESKLSPWHKNKKRCLSTSSCFVVLWELTDSTGVAEAGIPLKINILLSPQPPFNSNSVKFHNKRESCASKMFFLLVGDENLFSSPIPTKKRDWNFPISLA